jgi:glycosyltransferase involved in cell wall biosynthesis
MRIAHFIHRYPPALGGSEAFFARLSCYLASQGNDVEVHTTNALDLEAFWSSAGQVVAAGAREEHGVQVHRHAIRHWPLQRYMLKALSLIPVRRLQCATSPCNPIAPSMWRVSGENPPVDIVHATAFPYAFPILCGLRLARRWRVPFVLTPFLHLGDAKSRRGYLSSPMRYLLCAADHVFAQTEIERQAILESGVRPERTSLLGMGVDPAECTGGNRGAARERWGLALGDVVIGHLANKSVEKGTVDLLQAAEQLSSRGVGFKLVLAGPEMPNFIEFWKSRDWGANVIRLGALSEKEKRDFYAAIDIFAMPSRSDSFGIVFLEGWANGAPCVAYRAGGVAEVIRHDQDGLLAECGDLTGLAACLHELITQPAKRDQLGRVGRDRVLTDMLWPPKLARVRELYQQLVAQKKSVGERRV